MLVNVYGKLITATIARSMSTKVDTLLSQNNRLTKASIIRSDNVAAV